jgi:hypothetical protein
VRNRHLQAWLTEELDGEGNLLATEKHSNPNKEHFERGYRDGLECGDLQAKRLEADEMFDACGMVCHELIKANPHTARHFGYAVSEEKIQQYDEELDGVLKSRTYWERRAIRTEGSRHRNRRNITDHELTLTGRIFCPAPCLKAIYMHAYEAAQDRLGFAPRLQVTDASSERYGAMRPQQRASGGIDSERMVFSSFVRRPDNC